MASSISKAKLVCLFWLFILLAAASSEEAVRGQTFKKTEMSFYVHDWRTPTNQENITDLPITGKKGQDWCTSNFGAVVACDDAITTTIDRKSPVLGRAHGVYVNTALDGSDLYILVSFVFSKGAYNGSTLGVQGVDRLFQSTWEVSVA